MNYQSISVTPLTPNIGAEIGKIDLTKPLSNHEVKELHDAFAEFQVIFFRDQPIDLDHHVALARHFGELHIHVGPSTESKALPDRPEIRMLHFDETSEKVAGELWHTDQSCAEIPRSAVSCTSIRCRRTAAARPCFPACMRPTMSSRRR